MDTEVTTAYCTTSKAYIKFDIRRKWGHRGCHVSPKTQRWTHKVVATSVLSLLFSRIFISTHGTSTSISTSTSTSASTRTSTSTNISMSTSTCINANTSTRDEAECAKREQLGVTGGSLLCNITRSAIIRTDTTVLLMSKSSLGRCLKQSIPNYKSPVTRSVPSN
jgi:hypothetical protein